MKDHADERRQKKDHSEMEWGVYIAGVIIANVLRRRLTQQRIYNLTRARALLTMQQSIVLALSFVHRD